MNMNEKDSNTFKFVLTQGQVLLCEKMIDANQFNPITRYSINIRDILPKAITKLQKALSRKNYDVICEVGRKDVTVLDSENYDYDLYEYYSNLVESYPRQYRDNMYYNPQPITQQIEERTIKGVECKIGFYINEKPIVERQFYVDGFNPMARWSTELTEAVVDITDAIFYQIKRDDVKNMWDDYDLINIKGFSISQIREFPIGKRLDILRSMRN
jgi:hypothetical protein